MNFHLYWEDPTSDAAGSEWFKTQEEATAKMWELLKRGLAVQLLNWRKFK